MKQRYESKEFEEQYHYEGELGALYTSEKTQFIIHAPEADEVRLNLYEKYTDSEASKAIVMTPGDRGIFSSTVEGDCKNRAYTYTIVRDNKSVTAADMYSKAVTVNGEKSVVIDLKDTNPQGFDIDTYYKHRPDNAIIYELHVKDFSYDKNSGVREEYRGRYLAFTEENTTFEGKNTCISYLKELGITHVHLLPVFDFASIDETGDNSQFNWGYDPLNYMVPEGSYSTDATNPLTRIKEMKEMILALHNAGIGVIMDVVYNHTYSLDSVFEKTLPGYYYRQFEDDTYSDGSACGNETASERSMFRKYIIDSVLYWATEYHIDGFRFDLMGLCDTDTLNILRKKLNKLPNGEKILVYGEPWTAAKSPMKKGMIPAVKANIDKLDEGIAIFCDNSRDAIKGSVFIAEGKGFVQGKELEDEICDTVTAWYKGTKGFPAHSPKQIITYVSAHDNYTLYDKLILSAIDEKESDYVTYNPYIVSINKLVAAIVFTSLGTPFIQAGEEFARTKEGDENSYKSSPEINMLSWSRKNEYETLTSYYKGLIRLRKEFSGFNMTDSNDIAKNITFIKKEKGVVSFKIKALSKTDRYKELYIIYNAADRINIVDTQGYKVIADDTKVYDEGIKVTDSYIMPPKSALILAR